MGGAKVQCLRRQRPRAPRCRAKCISTLFPGVARRSADCRLPVVERCWWCTLSFATRTLSFGRMGRTNKEQTDSISSRSRCEILRGADLLLRARRPVGPVAALSIWSGSRCWVTMPAGALAMAACWLAHWKLRGRPALPSCMAVGVGAARCPPTRYAAWRCRRRRGHVAQPFVRPRLVGLQLSVWWRLAVQSRRSSPRSGPAWMGAPITGSRRPCGTAFGIALAGRQSACGLVHPWGPLSPVSSRPGGNRAVALAGGAL